MIDWILNISILERIWKIGLTFLLFFGSLLWAIAIIAVIWGFFEGFIPAVQKKQYKKAYIIFLIIVLTVTIILLSVKGQAIYLLGFIIPIMLLVLYIRKFTNLPYQQKNDFHNN